MDIYNKANKKDAHSQQKQNYFSESDFGGQNKLPRTESQQVDILSMSEN